MSLNPRNSFLLPPLQTHAYSQTDAEHEAIMNVIKRDEMLRQSESQRVK